MKTNFLDRFCIFLLWFYLADDETQQQNRNAALPLQTAQFLFPSCLCSAIVQIVDLLDDSVLTPDGVAVCDLANQVWIECTPNGIYLELNHEKEFCFYLFQ